MSEVISKAVTALAAKFAGGFDGAAKFVVTGEGAIMVDSAGVRAGDEAADVTLTASAEDFEAMLRGDLPPAKAYMTGKLAVAGDLGMAMKLGAALA